MHSYHSVSPPLVCTCLIIPEMLYREHEFYITCEGEKLEEYDIRLESEGTISCLIPSEAGKVNAG